MSGHTDDTRDDADDTKTEAERAAARDMEDTDRDRDELDRDRDHDSREVKTGADGKALGRDGKPRHADHSGVAQSKEDREKEATRAKEARAKRRESVRSGHLEGKWFVTGNTLVNMANVSTVTLPREGDENPTVVITTMGGSSTVISGEDVDDFLEEFGLAPTPRERDKPDDTVTESGRIVSRADLKAERIPGRENRVPNHPHRANAVLTNAETDDDVQARAGSAVIPPARPTLLTPLPDTPATDADADPETRIPEGEGEDVVDPTELEPGYEGQSQSGHKPAKAATRTTKPGKRGRGNK